MTQDEFKNIENNEAADWVVSHDGNLGLVIDIEDGDGQIMVAFLNDTKWVDLNNLVLISDQDIIKDFLTKLG